MASAPGDINTLTVSQSDVEFLRDEDLGRGAYGRVFKAKYRGSLCAAKEIHLILIEAAYTPAEREKLQDSFRRECDHCSKLNHVNIVHFIGMYYPPQQSFPVMLMELLDESLTKYAEKQEVSFKVRVSILHDVAEGLIYLHTRNPPVIHRDLSPNNVLLKHLPEFTVAKIADLGVARIIHVDDTRSTQNLTKVPGTMHFMPPEAFYDNPKYDTSLDVFSYGGIILHTINGEWPTPKESTKYDTVKRQVVGFSEIKRRQEHLNKMTGEADVLRPLVEACLDNDPAKRPSMNRLSEKMKEIKNHGHVYVSHKITNMLHKSEDSSRKLKKLTLTRVKSLNQDLGKGTYCQVYTVKHSELFYAAKEICQPLVKAMDKEEKLRFQNNLTRECCCCSELTHPNIVHFMGIYYLGLWQPLPAVIMELMDEPLTVYLNKQNVALERKVKILYDVAEGLNYLQTNKPPIIHCNLTTDNVLLRHLSIHPIAKICSFSMLRVLLADVDTRLTVMPETLAFMPPEVFTGEDVCDTSLDVFSYGAVMLHTIIGERPMPTALVQFNTLECQTRAYSEVERRQGYLNKVTAEAKVLRPLIEACLDNDPIKRPSISELSATMKPLKESPPLGLALRSNCYELAWEKCADLPLPCYGMSLALHDNKVYAMAAGASDKAGLNHVFVYDIQRDRWDRLPPSGHRKGILQIIDNKLTVIGGQDTITKEITNKVTTFTENKWTKVFPDMIQSRLNPGAVVYLNYVIVVGGALDGSAYSDNIELLDWKEPDQWVIAKLKLPEPMWLLSLTISADLLCIVGYNKSNGRTTAALQVPVDTIISSAEAKPLLKGQIDSWSKLPKAPCAGAAIIPNSCPPVIIGGYNHQDFTSDINMLDASSNSWKKIASLTTPRRYPAVVLLNNDSILVIGGSNDGKGKIGAIIHSIAAVEKGTMHVIQ